MDFHLDSLLNLPNVTVLSCQQQEGFVFLSLDFLNEGILCPHCQTYTDNLHQTRPILVRDLSIVEQGVYLKVQGLKNKIKLILRQSYGVKDFG